MGVMLGLVVPRNNSATDLKAGIRGGEVDTRLVVSVPTVGTRLDLSKCWLCE